MTLEASIAIFAFLFLLAACIGPDAIDAFFIACFLNIFVFGVIKLLALLT